MSRNGTTTQPRKAVLTMTRNKLYEIERQAYAQKLEVLKNEIRTEKEAYIKGLEKGWDMFFSVVRNALAEDEKGGEG